MIIKLLLWVLQLAFIAGTATHASSTTTDLIHNQVERLRSEQGPQIDGATIAATSLLANFYEHRGFRLAWFDRERIDDLLVWVNDAYDHGLDPNDYHLSRIQTLLDGGHLDKLTPRQRVALDFLLTDSLARLAYHSHFGKVDPASLDPNWNFERRSMTEHPVDDLEAAITSGSLEQFLSALLPEPYFYVWLRKGLARHRQIAADGGWPILPSGATLTLGTVDARVKLLRERLRSSGDLTGLQPEDSQHFDEELRKAVVAFQARHGLDTDGAVGAKTLRAMNVPVKRRIDQIRVNLERMRWVYQNLPDDYLLVQFRLSSSIVRPPAACPGRST